jgi:GGDEF domain-containing protein
MALHTVEGDRTDYDKFRRDFERIQVGTTQRASARELLVAAGAANQALADYGYRTARFIRQQGAILHNIISMLMQTMISIGAGTEASAEYLQKLERELARAVVVEDVQQLKLRLGACLEDLREESARQKGRTQTDASQIQEQVDRARNCIRETLALTDQIDSVTGLRTPPDAKAALEEALQRPEQKYVATIVVNRLQSINSRFGYATGNRVLKMVLELLSLNLSNADQIFRWSGPAFVALLERDQTLDAVRAEIGNISSRNLESIFDVGGRPVLLPITASSLVIPLTPPVMAISESVERFIESHTEDPVAYSR